MKKKAKKLPIIKTGTETLTLAETVRDLLACSDELTPTGLADIQACADKLLARAQRMAKHGGEGLSFAGIAEIWEKAAPMAACGPAGIARMMYERPLIKSTCEHPGLDADGECIECGESCSRTAVQDGMCVDTECPLHGE